MRANKESGIILITDNVHWCNRDGWNLFLSNPSFFSVQPFLFFCRTLSFFLLNLSLVFKPFLFPVEYFFVFLVSLTFSFSITLFFLWSTTVFCYYLLNFVFEQFSKYEIISDVCLAQSPQKKRERFSSIKKIGRWRCLAPLLHTPRLMSNNGCASWFLFEPRFRNDCMENKKQAIFGRWAQTRWLFSDKKKQTNKASVGIYSLNRKNTLFREIDSVAP